MGMPWAFILELHGWWHILTGIGAYICISTPLVPRVRSCNTNEILVIALVEYLTSEDVGQPLGRGLAWPARWLVDGSVLQKNLNKNDVGVAGLNKGKGKKTI